MEEKARKRLLVILPRVPWPLEKGDKLRAWHQLRELSKWYDIHLFALNEGRPHPDAYGKLKPFILNIHFFSLSWPSRVLNVFRALMKGLPMQVGYFYNKKAHRRLIRISRDISPDHVYFQLARTAEYAEGLPFPKTLDLQDAFSAGVKRRLDKAPWYFRPIFRLEYRRMLRYETGLSKAFRHLTIISEIDRDLIRGPAAREIKIVPNGVDTDYFRPREMRKEYDILFTGNMAYPPNVDAAVFLVRDIMPVVWKKVPQAKVLIAGASPVAEVKSLAGENVRISGWMDDIRDAYASSRIFIAPMRIGTGMQNKLLEAMAMRLPCITTPHANKPLRTKHGENLLTGEGAGELADHILLLMKDKDLSSRLAVSGNEFVKERYSWEGATAILREIMFEIS